MNWLRTFFSFLWRHKYLCTAAIFIIIIGLVGSNSLWERWQNRERIKNLEEAIGEYKDKYERDTKRLNELDNSQQALQKFARERYYMKAENEDVYIIQNKDTAS